MLTLTNMVELLVRFVVTPRRAHDLIQALRSVTSSLQREGVCQAARVMSNVDDANVVWYWEEWPGIEEFESHVRSDCFTRLLAVIETAPRAPLLECRVVAETRGIEYLAAARGLGVDARG